MNFTSIFVDNGHLNWNAINTLSNIILVGSLILVTFLYAQQVKKQTGFMRIDRVVKEMEILVAPLYSKIGDTNIYLKGAPGYKDSHFASHREHFRFWDEVKQNKYLAPSYLRSAIDNYQKK